MKKLKVGIYKMLFFDNGHKRWFGADLTRMIEKGKFDIKDLGNKKVKRPKLPIIDLGEYPEIQTEKQFLKYIYENWDAGTFMVIAYRGRANTFVFWKGVLDKDGFCFFQQEYDRSEINKLKRERAFELKEGEKELAEMSQEMIKEIKGEAKEEKRDKRYGFYPFLKSSGRRGNYILWDSNQIERQNENWSQDQEENKFDDWGKTEKKEYEKW